VAAMGCTAEVLNSASATWHWPLCQKKSRLVGRDKYRPILPPPTGLGPPHFRAALLAGCSSSERSFVKLIAFSPYGSSQVRSAIPAKRCQHVRSAPKEDCSS
jgi:hypothetical protein